MSRPDAVAPFLRFFPYDEPYDNQREAMDRIHDALSEGRDVLFEGACGTGKTLAALAPALEHAGQTDRTVVITTNVHQQTRQFIAEARAITDDVPIRTVVFRGKTSMCHIDVGFEECQALRDTTRDLVDLEADIADLERRQDELLAAAQAGDADAAAARESVMAELEDRRAALEDAAEAGATCERYRRNLVSDTGDFYAWLHDGVRTPDEIYDRADEAGLCGYELLKEGLADVDLVVCNYHHLLDPVIREQFFRWLGRDPDEVVAVFDEAHNVEEAARDHATRTLAESTLEGALSELGEAADGRTAAAERVLGAFRRALVDTYDDALGFGDRERIGEDWVDLAIDGGEGRDDLTVAFLDRYAGPGYREDLDRALALGGALDARYEELYKAGETDQRRECRTLQAASFLERWMDASDQTGIYPVVSVRRDDGGVVGRAELYTCIPRRVTEPLFADLHASVLMSATLRPFDVLADVLGVGTDGPDPATLAYGQQFPPERRRTYAVGTPALFARRRDDPEVQAAVAGVLEDAVRCTPGNLLAFFPSYAEAERYYGLVETAATPYLDRPGERAQSLRETFVAGDDGVLFTSLWGTLAEGVSYDGDDARTVAVVGVPYPHLDDRMTAVQDAYAAAFGAGDREPGGSRTGRQPGGGRARDEAAGWRYAVEIPTVRKTRQAVGRVVRSPEDFGARLLVDERYTAARADGLGDYSVHGTFPADEREELIDIAPDKLQYSLLNFYRDMGAWDGDPPDPV